MPKGQRVEAAGAAEDVDGFVMIPIKQPKGAISFRSFRIAGMEELGEETIKFEVEKELTPREKAVTPREQAVTPKAAAPKAAAAKGAAPDAAKKTNSTGSKRGKTPPKKK